MSKKPQANIKIAADFHGVVDEFMPLVAGNRRWMVYAAGLLALLRLTSRERAEIFQAVRAEDYSGGDWKALIDKARLEGEPTAVATEVKLPPNGKRRTDAEPAESPGPKRGGRRKGKGFG